MQSKSKIAVTLALMGALVFVSMVLDRYLSPYLPVSFAIVTLTVTVSFGLIRDNPWITLSCGAAFGLASFLVALLLPSATSEAFINPLVSVLPRLFIGPAVFGAYRAVRYTLHRKKANLREHAAVSAAGFFAAAVNTTATLSAMTLFGGSIFTGPVLKVLILANALPEAVLTAVLSPLVVLPVRRALQLRPKVYPVPQTAEAESRPQPAADGGTSADGDSLSHKDKEV